MTAATVHQAWDATAWACVYHTLSHTAPINSGLCCARCLMIKRVMGSIRVNRWVTPSIQAPLYSSNLNLLSAICFSFRSAYGFLNHHLVCFVPHTSHSLYHVPCWIFESGTSEVPVVEKHISTMDNQVTELNYEKGSNEWMSRHESKWLVKNIRALCYETSHWSGRLSPTVAHKMPLRVLWQGKEGMEDKHSPVLLSPKQWVVGWMLLLSPEVLIRYPLGEELWFSDRELALHTEGNRFSPQVLWVKGSGWERPLPQTLDSHWHTE